MKLCVNCRHVIGPPSWTSNAADDTQYFCVHPKHGGVETVLGRPITKPCAMARTLGNHCGPSGVLWEAKDDASA